MSAQPDSIATMQQICAEMDQECMMRNQAMMQQCMDEMADDDTDGE